MTFQQPLVCCATDQSPPTTPEPTPTTPAGPFTGDPEQHPNRHLLPAVDISTVECGTSDFTIKIIGGEEADLGEFPWVVGLGYESEWPNGIFFCFALKVGIREVGKDSMTCWLI